MKNNYNPDGSGYVPEKTSIAPPVYSQIALDIASKIARGDLKENSKITGRSLLATTYAVSPETIRRSMRLLADVGIIDIKSNSGAIILSKDNAIKYVDNFNNVRSVRTLKRELKELLNERDAINKKVIDLIDEIINVNEHLKNIDPLQNYEIEILPGSSIIGKSIEESHFWQNTGATIVAIRRQDRIILSPGPYASFLEYDSVVVVGDRSVSERVRNFINN